MDSPTSGHRIIVDEYQQMYSPKEKTDEHNHPHHDKKNLLPKSPKSPATLKESKSISDKSRKKDSKPEETTNELISITEYFFKAPAEGFSCSDFEAVTVNLCHLSKYLNTTLFEKLQAEKYVTYVPFLTFWKSNLQGREDDVKMFNILKNKDGEYITSTDLIPFVESVISLHPGLQFLTDKTFQDFYRDTIISRIFYTINTHKNGKISLAEFKKSKFHKILENIEKDPDINNELHFFSYEHFYVLYCRFWDIDLDHDFLISKHDLQSYDAINPLALDRLFNGSSRSLHGNGKMTYQDFVWFCLSEEDKSTIQSIEYWFRILDVDGDDVLTHFELKQFYDAQHDVTSDMPSFDDLMELLDDLIKSQNPPIITLHDLKRSKMSFLLLNAFINYKKFESFDLRDPLQKESLQSFWVRFARSEYDRMAEEDIDDDAETPVVNMNGFRTF